MRSSADPGRCAGMSIHPDLDPHALYRRADAAAFAGLSDNWLRRNIHHFEHLRIGPTGKRGVRFTAAQVSQLRERLPTVLTAVAPCGGPAAVAVQTAVDPLHQFRGLIGKVSI